MKRMVPLSIALLLLLTVWAAAESGFRAVALTVTTDTHAARTLVVQGNAEDNLYLGVSCYPAKFTDALAEGDHRAFEIRKGNFSQEVVVPARLSGGTWEAALWSKKVLAKDCTIKDCWFCKHWGYHLDGQVAYIYGNLDFIGK